MTMTPFFISCHHLYKCSNLFDQCNCFLIRLMQSSAKRCMCVWASCFQSGQLGGRGLNYIQSRTRRKKQRSAHSCSPVDNIRHTPWRLGLTYVHWKLKTTVSVGSAVIVRLEEFGGCRSLVFIWGGVSYHLQANVNSTQIQTRECLGPTFI